MLMIISFCYWGCRAIVLAYNIPNVTTLVLTREQIVGIYNGSINRWSDPTFGKYNPGIVLPNATIVPVARYESSTGSTEIFSTSLSSFSDAWATHYGVFSKPTGWNSSVVKHFAQRISGMADFIRNEPYRIGLDLILHRTIGLTVCIRPLNPNSFVR